MNPAGQTIAQPMAPNSTNLTSLGFDSLLPEDKVAAIRELQQQGRATLAVGGANDDLCWDDPLLVSAEVGVLWAASTWSVADR